MQMCVNISLIVNLNHIGQVNICVVIICIPIPYLSQEQGTVSWYTTIHQYQMPVFVSCTNFFPVCYLIFFKSDSCFSVSSVNVCRFIVWGDEKCPQLQTIRQLQVLMVQWYGICRFICLFSNK